MNLNTTINIFSILNYSIQNQFSLNSFREQKHSTENQYHIRVKLILEHNNHNSMIGSFDQGV